MSKSPIVKYAWIALVASFVSVTLWAYAVSFDLFGMFGAMPSTENLANPKSEIASEVYTEDGVLLGKYFKENRSPAAFDELSPNLLHALFATEDIRYEQHTR